jgi:hypothetical protein
VRVFSSTQCACVGALWTRQTSVVAASIAQCGRTVSGVSKLRSTRSWSRTLSQAYARPTTVLFDYFYTVALERYLNRLNCFVRDVTPHSFEVNDRRESQAGFLGEFRLCHP